jgi:hypothetical protein
LQHVFAVWGAVSEQTVSGVAQGREPVSADLEGDERADEQAKGPTKQDTLDKETIP